MSRDDLIICQEESMKIRNIAIAAAATLAASVTTALPVGVSAHMEAASISKVSIKMVVPSTVNTQGSFKLSISGVGTFKSFDLYRKASNISGSFVELKSKVNGKAYTDTEQDSFGETTYGMVPWSGLNDTGSKGAEVYSLSFYPASETEGGGTSFCYDDNGTGTYVTGSKWYGGEAFVVSGPDTVWCYAYYYSYNDGMIIGVGPGGATAKVYANGTGTGTTINFNASTTNGSTEGYKHGLGTANATQYEIVNTGSGTMWFTGMVQTASSIA
jgi:hypothetical protein